MRSEKRPKVAVLAAHGEQAIADALRILECDAAKARPMVARVLRELGASLCDQRLSATKLLRKSGLNRSAAAVPFRIDLGQPIYAYIRATFFEVALWFLFHTEAAVAAVAELAGFSSSRQFQRAVHKLLGISLEELELKVALVAEKNELPSMGLYSRRCWQRVQKSELGKAESTGIFNLLQELYPEATNQWLGAASDFATREDSRITAVLMESFWELLVTVSRLEQRQYVKQVFRCSSEEFFHFLCRKSLEVNCEPDRCVEVMELAIESLRESPQELSDNVSGLKALGLARLANAYMLASDFGSARRHLAEARHIWAGVEGRNIMFEAEIYACEARRHLFQGDLGAARKLLGKSIDICRSKPPGRLLALCLNERSLAVGYSGDWAGAIRDLRAAEDALEYQNEPRLKLIAAGNLALFHVLAGQLDKAEAHLARAWVLCVEGSDLVIQQHLFWTQGLIYHTRGELENAACAFEKARRGFEKLQRPGYQAIVALELALVRHKQERFAEVIQLASIAIPVLEQFHHVAGVSTALKMLREAIEGQQLAYEVLEQVHTELFALWRDPTADLGAVKHRRRLRT